MLEHSAVDSLVVDLMNTINKYGKNKTAPSRSEF